MGNSQLIEKVEMVVYVFFLFSEVCAVICSYNQFHINAKIVVEGGVWMITGFYCNLETLQHVLSWDILRYLKGMCNLPYVCGGDFNEIIEVREKLGGAHK